VCVCVCVCVFKYQGFQSSLNLLMPSAAFTTTGSAYTGNVSRDCTYLTFMIIVKYNVILRDERLGLF